MPPSWIQYCIAVPVVWAVGAEGEMYPENVGLPMGEKHGGVSYVMFEIHYDNPDSLTFKDQSGFKIFYTDKVRPNDLVSIAIGNQVSPYHVVPPGAKSFRTVGGCTEECTQKAIPPEGITATHLMFHAHVQAKTIKLRHIRNGVELEPLSTDNNYDFNYQQSRVIKPPRKILPGDILLNECTYDSEKNKYPIYGGLSTREEMCMTFLYTYPRVDLALCFWYPEYDTFYNAVGINKVEGDVLKRMNSPYRPKPDQKFDPPGDSFLLQNSTNERLVNAFDVVNIVEPAKLRGKSVGDYMREIDWKGNNGQMVKKVERDLLNGKHYAFCSKSGRARIPLDNLEVKLPKFREFKTENKCQALPRALRQTHIMYYYMPQPFSQPLYQYQPMQWFWK